MAGGGVNLTSPCGFSKIVSSKKRVTPWFFVTFNIILRHIFPENFIEFPQVVQKIWRNSLSILANFHQFSSIFWIFWHYLVTKKPMMSAYNRWCLHFFYLQHTLNRLFNFTALFQGLVSTALLRLVVASKWRQFHGDSLLLISKYWT